MLPVPAPGPATPTPVGAPPWLPSGRATGRGLGAIFEPRSIAIVGASANPEKRGHHILRSLGESGYAGRVYAVNRTGGPILGHEAFGSVSELPEAVDLAVLSLPAAATPEVIRECGQRGIAGAVVLAVGFGEAGPEGARLEAELRRAAVEAEIRVVGPNTSGLLNLAHGINLIGARGIRPGRIALLSQSGNIVLGLMNGLSAASRLGVSVCCGLGNEVDVGFGEVLEFLGSDPETRAVVVHLEGTKDARRFLSAAAAITPHKPVIVLKTGRTAPGARSALSHTGAIAGPYERLRAGFRQAGVVEVTRSDELLPVAEALAAQPAAPPGSGIGILSDGGGQSTLAVDALSELGAPLAELAPGTSAALRSLLGPAAAVRTPVDVAGAGDTNPGVFPRALEVLAADPAVGAVLVVGIFGGYALRFSDTLAPAEAAAARAISETMRRLGKGLVLHSQYACHPSEPLDLLRDAHVPVIESLDAACRATAELHRRGAPGARRGFGKSGFGDPREGAASHPVIAAARAEGRVALTETESRALLEDADLGFGPMEVARSPAEAASAAVRAGRPVALKLLSRYVVHKSDAGGVALEIAASDGGRAAAAAFERIAESARGYALAHAFPEEAIAVTVSPMLPVPVLELLVGAVRDPELGPALTLAAGGVFAELLADATHRVLPTSASEIDAALRELTASPLLDGARGRPAVSRTRIVKAAAAVGDCLLRYPEVAEVEVNPLFVYPDRVAAVDARVVLRPASAEGFRGAGVRNPSR